MAKRICSIVWAVAFLIVSNVGYGQGGAVYRNVGPDGTVTYTDIPSEGGAGGKSYKGGSKVADPHDSAERASSGNGAGTSQMADDKSCGTGRTVMWADYFDQRLEGWGKLDYFWGRENVSFIVDPVVPGKVMKVFYPSGTFDPATMKRFGWRYGGAGLRSALIPGQLDCVFFRYLVKFADNFQFVRGGKLPGLYGGKGIVSGVMPNGYDGFTSRYMWVERGGGSIYAYLPTSVTWGTYLGKGKFTFQPGVWHTLQQQVVLNAPGRTNGVIRVWLDGKLVVNEQNLRFRDTSTLHLTGIYFDTFFGGNDRSWATPVDTSIEFGAFVLSEQYVE